MTFHSIRIMAVAALLTATASAQSTRVWPIGYASVAGNAAQATPFSIAPNAVKPGSRNATLFEETSLPFGAGTTLTAISFRRDARSSQPYPARSGRIQVRIGSVDDAMQPRDGAVGLYTGEPESIAGGSVTLPAAPPPGSGPSPFSFTITFREPWTYPGGDFAIDVMFTGAAGVWSRDAVWFQPQVDGDDWTIGAGCVGSTSFTPQTWIEPESLVAGPGGRILLTMQGAPLPATPGGALLLVGAPLPFSLPLDGLGLPTGCELHVQALIEALPVDTHAPTPAYTHATVSVPLPPNAADLNGVLAFQWLIADPAIGTQLPIIVSNAILFEVGSPAPSDPGYGRSFWGHDVTSVNAAYTARLSPPNWVPVVQFHGTFQ